jgi:hypothetical protein
MYKYNMSKNKNISETDIIQKTIFVITPVTTKMF